MARWTRYLEAHELMNRLQSAGVEAGAVQTSADLLADPQLAHRGHFQRLPHEHLGELAFEHYGIRPSMSPPQLRTPGPNLGEHNDEILGGLLGYTPEEIRDLTEREILV